MCFAKLCVVPVAILTIKTPAIIRWQHRNFIEPHAVQFINVTTEKLPLRSFSIHTSKWVSA